MPSVRIRENEYFDAALKPTQERKRKKAAAVKRHMKRLSRDGGMRSSAPR